MASVPESSQLFRFGVFEADLQARELRKNGIKLKVHDQPIQILGALLERPGEVVTREELRQKLWPTETFVDFDHSINTSVNKLREVLGDSADSPRFIETLARRGYRFVAPVEVVVNGAIANTSETPPPSPKRWNSEALAWSLFAVVSLALALLSAVHFRQRQPQARTVRFQIALPDNVSFGPDDIPVLSPDGRSFVFRARSPDGAHLWIHSFDSLTTRMLPITGYPSYPFWSPDSRFIGFFLLGDTNDQLKKLDVSSGAQLTICNVKTPVAGGTWSANGMILIAQAIDIYRVSAAGGEPRRVLDPEPVCKARLMPSFLPDGRHFLYGCFASPTKGTVNLGSIDSNDTRSLIPSGSNAAYAPPGYLIYGRQGTLFARPFDLQTLRATDESFPIAQQVGHEPDDMESHFSISNNSVLIYHSNSNLTQLAWYNRNGVRQGSIGEPGNYELISLSPDDTRLAVERRDSQTNNLNIWTLDLSNGISSRQTFHPTDDWYPVWSPDGREFVFVSNRRKDDKPALYRKMVGGGDEELLFTSSDAHTCVHQWLTDNSILFIGADEKAFYLLPLSGGRKAARIRKAESDWVAPHVSPDGQWVAYHSHESGRWEVYIAAFPTFTERRQVSNAGGFNARWRKDGNELFYLSLDNTLMSLEVKRGLTLRTGVPRTLFKTPFAVRANYQYSVTGDGKRFIFNEPVKEASQPFTVVLNWAAGLN